jgi:PAS domain S-box-containing protein
MAIDIQTFSLILGVTHFMQILVFFYLYKANKAIKGPGWWLLWSGAETVGFIFIFLRKSPFFLPYSIILQDPILLVGTLFICIGIVNFFEQKVNLKFFTFFFISFIVLHLFYYFVIDSIKVRSVIFCIYIAVIALITAIKLNRLKTKSIELTANLNIAILIIHTIVFVFRGLIISLEVETYNEFAPIFLNSITYFDALIVSLFWTFGFIMMVTQRLNGEITEAKQHFEQIFNTNPDAALITRLSDGSFIDCNDSFTRITGYTKEDIVGKSTIGINLWENPDDRLKIVQMVTIDGYCNNFETLFRQKNGQLITGLISANIILIKETPHLISVIRDITYRKQVEEELKNKNLELNKLNTEKNKFFSIIAHDLRGPISSFIVFTDILVRELHDVDNADIKELAGKMKGSATHLFSLLDNLLEWSRMEQGAIFFNPAMVPLHPLIDESLAMILEPARLKGVEITYDIPNDLEIYADKNILQTVFRNLVSNAVKFTPMGGKITLSVFTCNDKVEILIKDTGIGMSPEMIDNLFKLNVQTNRRGTNGEPSTGLGLFLCKDFIERHGGYIWVESKEGEGSTFHFSIACHKNLQPTL